MRMLVLTTALALGLQPAADARQEAFTGKYTNGFDRYPNVSVTLLQAGTHVRGMLAIVGDSSASRVVTASTTTGRHTTSTMITTGRPTSATI